MGGLERALLGLLGEDLLGDHAHRLGQLADEVALLARVVRDTDDDALARLGLVLKKGKKKLRMTILD